MSVTIWLFAILAMIAVVALCIIASLLADIHNELHRANLRERNRRGPE